MWNDINQESIFISETINLKRLTKAIQCSHSCTKQIRDFYLKQGKKKEAEEFSWKNIICLRDKIKNNQFTAEYVKSSSSQQFEREGRYYTKYGLGLQGLCRNLRQWVCMDYYWDVDMINAHPSIIFSICKNNNISCMALTDYIERREEVLDLIKNELGCDRGYAKVAFLKVLNGGGAEGSLTLKTVKDECTGIANAFKTLGLSSKFEAECKSKTKTNQAPLINRMMISLINATENEILFYTFNFFLKRGLKPSTLQFDGLFIYKEDKNGEVVERDILHGLFDGLSLYIKGKTGVDIKFEIKDMTDFIDEMLLVEDSAEEKEVLKQTFTAKERLIRARIALKKLK